MKVCLEKFGQFKQGLYICAINLIKKKDMNQIDSIYGTVSYPSTVGKAEGQVIPTLWEKGGKSRVYIKVRFSDGMMDCGYFDCENNKPCFRTRPAAIGYSLMSSVSMISNSSHAENYTDIILSGNDEGE